MIDLNAMRLIYKLHMASVTMCPMYSSFICCSFSYIDCAPYTCGQCAPVVSSLWFVVYPVASFLSSLIGTLRTTEAWCSILRDNVMVAFAALYNGTAMLGDNSVGDEIRRSSLFFLKWYFVRYFVVWVNFVPPLLVSKIVKFLILFWSMYEL